MKVQFFKRVLPISLSIGCLILAFGAPTWRTALAAAGYYNNSAVIFDCWVRNANPNRLSVGVPTSSTGAPVIADQENCAQAIVDVLNAGFVLDDVKMVQRDSANSPRSRFLFIQQAP